MFPIQSDQINKNILYSIVNNYEVTYSARIYPLSDNVPTTPRFMPN